MPFTISNLYLLPRRILAALSLRRLLSGNFLLMILPQAELALLWAITNLSLGRTQHRWLNDCKIA